MDAETLAFQGLPPKKLHKVVSLNEVSPQRALRAFPGTDTRCMIQQWASSKFSNLGVG